MNHIAKTYIVPNVNVIHKQPLGSDHEQQEEDECQWGVSELW